MPTATKIPPSLHEILPSVSQVLLGDSTLQTMLGGEDRVFVADADVNEAPTPDPDEHGFWARVVLMPVTKGLVEGIESLDRVTDYPFQARADVMPPSVTGYDTELALEVIHRRIFVMLEFREMSFTNARQVSPVRRTRRALRSFRDESGYRFSSSKYLTVLAPKN